MVEIPERVRGQAAQRAAVQPQPRQRRAAQRAARHRLQPVGRQVPAHHDTTQLTCMNCKIGRSVVPMFLLFWSWPSGHDQFNRNIGIAVITKSGVLAVGQQLRERERGRAVLSVGRKTSATWPRNESEH